MTVAELAVLVLIGVLTGLVTAFRNELPTWFLAGCVALEAAAFVSVVWHMVK